MCERDLRAGRQRRGRASRRSVESLEGRQLLAATPGQVVMLAASTVDSKGVTVEYQVKDANLDGPLVFGVYRSASSTFDATAVPVGTVTIPVSAVDAAGGPATAVGTHSITVPLAGGLPPNPMHPYVLVQADPGTPAAAALSDTTAFRVRTIAVIIHGGMQPKSWKLNGPPWEQKMAASLRAEGYDQVIAYNWVANSSTPGDAVREIPHVDKLIEAAAETMPGGPIDLQIIGHSEGAVIAGQAMLKLEPNPGIQAGFKVLTMLDPHAASNNFKGQQVSVESGLLGTIAKAEIDAYQSKAKDPAAYIPADVDLAQVYFQRTPVGATGGTNGGLYNLWGQVPVIAAAGVPVEYANLTGPGISHAGNFSVYDWYQINVVPKLGNGPAFVDPNAITATAAGSVNGSAPTSFHGTALPSTTIQIIAATGGKDAVAVGSTTTDAQGNWSLIPPHEALGATRYFARGDFPAMPGLPHVFTSTTVPVQASPAG
jgi:hypothetical protein